MIITIDKSYVNFILTLILLIICIFTYLGNIEYHKINKSKLTIAKINNINLEKKHYFGHFNVLNGVVNYGDNYLFRLKVEYSYQINNNKYKKKYNGFFYNNGKNKNYDKYYKIKEYWNTLKSKKYVKIYYLDENNCVSDIDRTHIDKKYARLYNSISVILFYFLIILNIIIYYRK